MAEGWELVAEARREVADLVEGLSTEQQQQQTWCGQWTPHQVLGHLTWFVDAPLPKFMFSIMKARGDYDTASDRMARELAERPVGELAETLRARASKKSAMPMFPPEMTLADVAIHTQDIRRGLGLEGALPDDVVRTSLDFLTQHKQAKNIFDTKKLDGLRLEATDMDWSHGSGATVSGKAEDLMMALAGRPTHDALNGEVDRLR